MEGVPINEGGGWTGPDLGGIFAKLPFAVSAELKVMGFRFDCGLSCTGQLQYVLDKARMRLAVLGRVAGFTWGLETNISRLASDALLVGPIRFGILSMGSGLFGKQLSGIETRITYIAGCRICRMGRTARLVILHIAAGVKSARNWFILNCAKTVGRALRVSGSSISTMASTRTAAFFGVQNRDAIPTEVARIAGLSRRTGLIGISEYDATGKWFFSALRDTPVEPRIPAPQSIFQTNAEEVRRLPNYHSRTSRFSNARDWIDVGIQVFRCIRRRREMPQTQGVNLDKCLPPKDATGRLVIRNSDCMRWFPQTDGGHGSISDFPDEETELMSEKMENGQL